MKKFYWIMATGVLLFGAACSGKGAYSEEEKKTQDSVDNVKHEKTFEQMEAEQRIADSLENLTKDSSKTPKPQ